MGLPTTQLSLITQPPAFCEYASGRCDQVFDDAPKSDGLFLYANEPTIISDTIEEAAKQLRVAAGNQSWLTWKDLGVSGQIIFCKICKALRFTRVAIADVTTLNFNLMFEIGYATGLGVPVLPIRDKSYAKDSKVFNELGLIDTIGYLDFENSEELVKKILECSPSVHIPAQFPGYRAAPVLDEKPGPKRGHGEANVCRQEIRTTLPLVRPARNRASLVARGL